MNTMEKRKPLPKTVMAEAAAMNYLAIEYLHSGKPQTEVEAILRYAARIMEDCLEDVGDGEYHTVDLPWDIAPAGFEETMRFGHGSYDIYW